MNTINKSPRCLSVKDTATKIGLSRSSIYSMLIDDSNDFPRPMKIGRRSYFLEGEIDNWILSRPRSVSKSKSGGVL